MLRRIFFLIILISPFKTFADAFPFKGGDSFTFTLSDHYRTVDSIYALVYSNHTDTLSWDSAGIDYSSCHGVSLHAYKCWDASSYQFKYDTIYSIYAHYRHTFKSFKIIIFSDGQRFESDILKRFPGIDNYGLAIDRNSRKLVDRSPLFHERWSVYIFSLLITLISELLIGYIYFGKNKYDKTITNYILTFSILNIATHIFVWYFYTHTYFPLILLELIVVFVESVYWVKYLKFSYGKALGISLLTNFASWIFGGILTLVLIAYGW